ncbi:MAG: conjugal transfer protein TraG N-terminal domain-containing protein [Sutterella wadsworthensis]|nr:conjugal transfer protein TraG N-terminal domain-containing protein [Sutterella wadsworthensis]
MATEAYPFYAYWNGEQVSDLWTTIAAMTSTSDYRTLLICVAVGGFLAVMMGAAVRYRGQDAITWCAATLLLFSVAFVPRININVLDVRGGYTQVIKDIPIGIGWPASTISRISYWLTQTFETAFNDVDATSYTRFGMAFPQRVVTSVLALKPMTEYGRVSLVNFAERCIVPEILDNPTKRQALMTAPDIYALISTQGWVNPARRVMIADQVQTCPAALETLRDALEKHELPALESMLVTRLSQTADDVVTGSVRAAIPNAEAVMLGVSRSLTESLRQSVMMAAIPQATMNTTAKAGQAPLTAGVAMARAQGNLASEINYRTLSEMAKSALPKLRNLLEFIVIGLFPITFLLAIGLGTGGVIVIRAYFTLLISVSLWAPITAIMNYLMIHVDAEPMNRMVEAAGGVTLAAATMIREGGATSQAMAGSLMWLVPVLSYAVAKGSDMALTSMASSVLAPASSAAQSQGSTLAAGNVAAGNASLSNVSANNVNANKTDLSSAYGDTNRHTSTSAYGTWQGDRSTGAVTAMNAAETNLGITASGSYQKTAALSDQNGEQTARQHAVNVGDGHGTQVQTGKGVESTTNKTTGWQDNKTDLDSKNLANTDKETNTIGTSGNESINRSGQSREDFGSNGKLDFSFSGTGNKGRENSNGNLFIDNNPIANLEKLNDLLNNKSFTHESKSSGLNTGELSNQHISSVGFFGDAGLQGVTSASKQEGSNTEFRTALSEVFTEDRISTKNNSVSKGTTTNKGANSQLGDKDSASLTKGHSVEKKTNDSFGTTFSEGKTYQTTEGNGIYTHVQFSNMVRDRALNRFGSADAALESLNQNHDARFAFGREIDELNKAMDGMTSQISNNVQKPVNDLPTPNEQGIEKEYNAETKAVQATYDYSAGLREQERQIGYDGNGQLEQVDKSKQNHEYMNRGLNKLANDEYFREQTGAKSTIMRSFLFGLDYKSPNEIFNELHHRANHNKEFADEVINLGRNIQSGFEIKR